MSDTTSLYGASIQAIPLGLTPVPSTDSLLLEIRDLVRGLANGSLPAKAARAVRAPKAPRDPLAELVAAIAAAKAAKGLPFDEAATRLRLADPAFKRKARQQPDVAAALAAAKGQPVPATASGLDGL